MNDAPACSAGVLINGTCICQPLFTGKDELWNWNECHLDDRTFRALSWLCLVCLSIFMIHSAYVWVLILKHRTKISYFYPKPYFAFHGFQLLSAMFGVARLSFSVVTLYHTVDMAVLPTILLTLTYGCYLSSLCCVILLLEASDPEQKLGAHLNYGVMIVVWIYTAAASTVGISVEWCGFLGIPNRYRAAVLCGFAWFPLFLLPALVYEMRRKRIWVAVGGLLREARRRNAITQHRGDVLLLRARVLEVILRLIYYANLATLVLTMAHPYFRKRTQYALSYGTVAAALFGTALSAVWKPSVDNGGGTLPITSRTTTTYPLGFGEYSAPLSNQNYPQSTVYQRLLQPNDPQHHQHHSSGGGGRRRGSESGRSTTRNSTVTELERRPSVTSFAEPL